MRQIALVLVFFFFIPSAWAISALSVSPSSQNIPADRSSMLNLRWTVTTGTVFNATSANGRFVAPNGVTLGTVGPALDSVGNCFSPCNINETLNIPKNVVDTAVSGGFLNITYERTWNDQGQPSRTGGVALSIKGTPIQVEAIPANVQVLSEQSTTLNIAWRVTLDPGAAVTVESPSGAFRSAGGALLGSIPSRLARAGVSNTVMLNETLTVPANVVAQAINLGLSNFVLVRTFSVGNASREGALTLNIVTRPPPPIGEILEEVIPSPTNTRLAVGRSSSVPIGWQIQITGSGNGLNIRSEQGRFLTPDGISLGTFNRALSRAGVSAPGGRISETVAIPAGVTFRAHKLGFNHLFYQRSFTDGTVTRQAQVVLNIVGGAAGGFAINRIDLHFDDLSRLRVVNKQDSLQAQADLLFTGSGLFSAEWEIATPSSTAGAVRFRPLRLIRQHLTGGGQIRLQSPQLPVAQVGRYLLRLRVQSPEFAFELPVIQYFVGQISEARHGLQGLPLPIRITQPITGVWLVPETRFAWQPVQGASTYLLEFYAKTDRPLVDFGSTDLPIDNQKPVSGVMLPGSQTETRLSLIALEPLKSGTSYRWQVLAIDKNGEVLGASPSREVYAP